MAAARSSIRGRAKWPYPDKVMANEQGPSGWAPGSGVGNFSTSKSGDKHGENWKPYFGEPNMPFERYPNQGYRREVDTVEMAYRGQNAYLQQIIITMLSEQDEIPMRQLLPWTLHSDGLTVTWDRWEFDDHLLTIEPTLSVPRLVTSRMSSGATSMTRQGIGMSLEFDFYKTEQGRKAWRNHIFQMINAIIVTMNLGVILALLNPAGYNLPREYQLTSQLKNETIVREWIRNHHTNQFILNIRPNGTSLTFEIIKRIFSQRVTGSSISINTIVTPSGTKSLWLDSKEANIKFGEPTSRIRYADTSSLLIWESRLWKQGPGLDPLDPTWSPRIYTTYSVMMYKNSIYVPTKEFRTDMMDIEIYDRDLGRFVRVQFKEAVKNTGLFDEKGSLTPGGTGWFGHPTWGTFMEEHGIMPRWLEHFKDDAKLSAFRNRYSNMYISELTNTKMPQPKNETKEIVLSQLAAMAETYNETKRATSASSGGGGSAAVVGATDSPKAIRTMIINALRSIVSASGPGGGGNIMGFIERIGNTIKAMSDAKLQASKFKSVAIILDTYARLYEKAGRKKPETLTRCIIEIHNGLMDEYVGTGGNLTLQYTSDSEWKVSKYAGNPRPWTVQYPFESKGPASEELLSTVVTRLYDLSTKTVRTGAKFDAEVAKWVTQLNGTVVEPTTTIAMEAFVALLDKRLKEGGNVPRLDEVKLSDMTAKLLPATSAIYSPAQVETEITLIENAIQPLDPGTVGLTFGAAAAIRGTMPSDKRAPKAKVDAICYQMDVVQALDLWDDIKAVYEARVMTGSLTDDELRRIVLIIDRAYRWSFANNFESTKVMNTAVSLILVALLHPAGGDIKYDAASVLLAYRAKLIPNDTNTNNNVYRDTVLYLVYNYNEVRNIRLTKFSGDTVHVTGSNGYYLTLWETFQTKAKIDPSGAYSDKIDDIKQLRAILNAIPISGDLIEFACDNNMPPLFDLMLIRQPRYEVGTVIGMVRGGYCGYTFYNNLNVFVAINTAQQLINVHVSLWAKSVIINSLGVVAVQDACVKAYLGGEGVTFWDPNDRQHIAEYQRGLDTASIVVAPMLFGEQPGKAQYTDTTGRFHSTLVPGDGNTGGRDRAKILYKAAKYLAPLWGWAQNSDFSTFQRDSYANNYMDCKSETFATAESQTVFGGGKVGSGNSWTLSCHVAGFGLWNDRVFDGVNQYAYAMNPIGLNEAYKSYNDKWIKDST